MNIVQRLVLVGLIGMGFSIALVITGFWWQAACWEGRAPCQLNVIGYVTGAAPLY